MNARLTRLLLRLYPKRIRDRYGNELVDLHDELRARDHISRSRLVKDMLTGAVLARPARQTVLALGVLLAAGGVATGGLMLRNAGSSRPALRALAQAPHIGNGVYYPPTATPAIPGTPHSRPRTLIAPQNRGGDGVYYPPGAAQVAPRSRPRAHVTTARTAG